MEVYLTNLLLQVVYICLQCLQLGAVLCLHLLNESAVCNVSSFHLIGSTGYDNSHLVTADGAVTSISTIRHALDDTVLYQLVYSLIGPVILWYVCQAAFCCHSSAADACCQSHGNGCAQNLLVHQILLLKKQIRFLPSPRKARASSILTGKELVHIVA